MSQQRDRKKKKQHGRDRDGRRDHRRSDRERLEHSSQGGRPDFERWSERRRGTTSQSREYGRQQDHWPGFQDFDNRQEGDLYAPFEDMQEKIIQSIAPTERELREKYPMEPTRMKGDIDWLEQHVRQSCDGVFPKKIEGVHTLEVQQGLIFGLKEKHMPME